jgi:hypothetical protein
MSAPLAHRSASSTATYNNKNIYRTYKKKCLCVYKLTHAADMPQQERHWAQQERHWAQQERHRAQQERHWAQQERHWAQQERHWAQQERHWAQQERHWAQQERHWAQQERHRSFTISKLLLVVTLGPTGKTA